MKKQNLTLHEIETALIDYVSGTESATIDEIEEIAGVRELIKEFNDAFQASPCDEDGAGFAQLELLDELTTKYANQIQNLIN